MKPTSERSFSEYLENGLKLRAAIKTFRAFKPPRAEETTIRLGKLLKLIAVANDAEVNQRALYNNFANKRINAFWADEISVATLIEPLREATDKQYGKGSAAFRQVLFIQNLLQSSNIFREEATETTTDTVLSQAEQFYESITQAIKDLIETLQAEANFAPSNPDIYLENIQTFCSKLDVLNASAAFALQILLDRRGALRTLNADLADRIERVKMYVHVHYGASSAQYHLIKEL